MPSVKDYEKKQGGHKHHAKADSKQKHHASAKSQKPRRRPGREHEAETPEVAVVNVHEDEALASSGADEATASVAEARGSAGASAEDSAAFTSNESEAGHDGDTESKDKVELHFYGSEILRAKFPQAFKIAESVATDWKHGGSFDDLSLDNPLAQYFAAKGLRKAKEVEKKVLESPLTEKMAMKALQAGLKAQGLISQWREKSQKK